MSMTLVIKKNVTDDQIGLLVRNLFFLKFILASICKKCCFHTCDFVFVDAFPYTTSSNQVDHLQESDLNMELSKNLLL
jgi:23S rRNA U2552 (ribose-2'-O)-methylase RlmE/FtsJ